nr:hypothetical protein [Listeria monocytogenes]
MLGERLCGGRNLREGLHARMPSWPVTRFASNGRMGVWVFDRWWKDFDAG